MAETTVTPRPAFVDRLVDALKRELTGADVSTEHIRGNRYRFVVVWSGFDGIEHPERQRRVWDVAEATVPRSDLLDVGMILTIAPSDYPDTTIV